MINAWPLNAKGTDRRFQWTYCEEAARLLVSLHAARPRASGSVTAGSRLSSVVYQSLGQTREADAAQARLTIESAALWPMGIAEAYAFRGQKDRAFDWLDKAYTRKDAGLWSIKGDPLLKNLEGDPRYKAFLRRMNLPQ